MIDSSVKMGQDLDVRFQELRGLILRVLIGRIQGHFGPVMLLVMISRVILDDFFRFKANEPNWPCRDRFTLSGSHGCLALV